MPLDFGQGGFLGALGQGLRGAGAVFSPQVYGAQNEEERILMQIRAHQQRLQPGLGIDGKVRFQELQLLDHVPPHELEVVRHVAEAPAQVFEGTTLPPRCGERTFLGPFFIVPEGDRGPVTHPEHDHFDLPPGCYQVTHQMDARTLDRVQD